MKISMNRLLTKNIATMTEMREPQKVLDRAGGEPVAILKNSQLVGYFVPTEAAHGDGAEYAIMDELKSYLERTRTRQVAGRRIGAH